MYNRTFRKKAVHLRCRVFTTFLLILSILSTLVPDITAFAEEEETYINYAEALQKSLYFYDAQKCGQGITGKRLDWRGDCHVRDGNISLADTSLTEEFLSLYSKIIDPDQDGRLDLSGGFHDEGDGIRFGPTHSYTAAALGWGFYEFKEAFISSGQEEHMREILKCFTDTILKCSFLDNQGNLIAFCHTLGNISEDHSFWGPPELFPESKKRPTLFATSRQPATSIGAQTSAALSLSYLNFKDTEEEYGKQCLGYAKAFYDFSKNYIGNSSIDGYFTDPQMEDDLSWAAIWLYIATNETKYLDDIILTDSDGIYTGFIQKVLPTINDTWKNTWVYSSGSVWGGVFVKLASLNLPVSYPSNKQFETVARWNLEYWSGGTIPHEVNDDVKYIDRTPLEFSYLYNWGANSYNCNAQLCSLVYQKYYPTRTDFAIWAKSQMDYIMGENSMGYSYIVGYGLENGVKSPTRVHHRAACSRLGSVVEAPNKHIIWGALVGGPDKEDKYYNRAMDFQQSSVSIEYNAGLVGALAGLYMLYDGKNHKIIPNFPTKEPDNIPYYCEAMLETDNNMVSEITIKLHNEFMHPPRYEKAMKARYFFNISELIAHGQSINDVYIQILNDQDATTSGPIKIEGPVKYDEIGTYYYEFDLTGQDFYGVREYKFTLAARKNSDNKAYWDSTNDWSRYGMDLPLKASLYIPVYINNVKVYGAEPPKVGYTPTSTQSTLSIPTITPTATATPVPAVPTPTPTSIYTTVIVTSHSQPLVPAATSSPTNLSTPAITPTPAVTPTHILMVEPSDRIPGGNGHDTTPKPTLMSTPKATSTPTRKPVVISDIKKHWAKGYIEYVTTLGIMDLKEKNRFAPKDDATREECAKAFTVLLYKVNLNKNEQIFKDVKKTDANSRFITAAYNEKIMVGSPDGFFYPKNAVTREDLTCTLAKMMNKYYGLKPIKASKGNEPNPKGTLKLPFYDVNRVSGYALDSVATTVNYGLITGKPGNVFDPKGKVTRTELAVVLCKLLKKYGHK